jgi:hypothetical protein
VQKARRAHVLDVLVEMEPTNGFDLNASFAYTVDPTPKNHRRTSSTGAMAESSMQIVEMYSHLNGWEYIQVHQPQVWTDITVVIGLIDAEACRTKRLLFSPEKLNKRFDEEFARRGWSQSIARY